MNGNPIHIRLNHEESIDSKKNILSLEMNLLKIIKIIERYKNLREEELDIKNSLSKKIKEILTEIKRLKTILPKIKEEKEERKKEKGKEKKKKKEDNEDIEFQLQIIKEKLKELGA